MRLRVRVAGLECAVGIGEAKAGSPFLTLLPSTSLDLYLEEFQAFQRSLRCLLHPTTSLGTYLVK